MEETQFYTNILISLAIQKFTFSLFRDFAQFLILLQLKEEKKKLLELLE